MITKRLIQITDVSRLEDFKSKLELFCIENNIEMKEGLEELADGSFKPCTRIFELAPTELVAEEKEKEEIA
jgi:hypothetical protein